VILTSPYASAAPQALYGKSVVVTWQEERQQKFPGEEQMRFVAAAAEFDVYVSDVGRPFSRLRFSMLNRVISDEIISTPAGHEAGYAWFP